MNVKATLFIKNMSYTISSNLISLIVSTLVVLIIPKLIGVEDYGYWQLYIFYSSYVGFLHFGWNDGIYLRFGGDEYRNLDKEIFFSQFIELLFTQIIIGFLIWLGSIVFVDNINREFIFRMVAITLILVNTRSFIFFILQATNRIKEFARITIIDRTIYIFLISIFLISGIRDFKLMIIADILSKFLSLVLASITCREIVYNKIYNFRFTIYEAFMNINVGMKLMFANIASMLIIGTVRFGIERAWDVATFGKVSLTLSISNMMMIFINAIGIVMFPILRRTNHNKLAEIYFIMRNFLMVLLLGTLLIYYPLKTILVSWLPQYEDSLIYLALIFPIFIFEGKMALLINTYFKTLRFEKVLLKINIITMILSIFLTYISTQVYYSLNFTILNILLLLVIRAAMAETFLAKILNINVKEDMILEFVLTTMFIMAGWFFDSWITFLLYGSVYCLYLIMKKEDIMRTFHKLELMIKM